MTTMSLGDASWTLAKDKLHLEVAAFASLDAHGLLQDHEDLLSKDVWINKGNKFHFSFHISFNGLSLDSGAPNEDTVPGFIASALTQAPFWSQLHLASSASLLGPISESRSCNGRSFTLNLKHDRGSDVDLSNVKPPNRIPAISLDFVQISLIFSQIPTPLERWLNSSKEASPGFEDLLGPENSLQIPDLDLHIPNWQCEEDEAPDDHEAILDPLPHSPVTLLSVIDDPLKSPSSYIPTASGPFFLPDSDLQSLETRNLVFSRQISNLLHQHDEDTVPSDEQLSLGTNKIGTSAISSSISTFEFLERERSSSIRFAGKETVCRHISPLFRAPLQTQDTIALCQPILNLTDVALRTLIHPQPTRVSSGIKFSRTDPVYDLYTSQDKSKPAALSDLAPSVFAPGFARGVVQRTPLIPSIAKSLATFLRYRHGSRVDQACGTESQRQSDEQEVQAQEEVKEILRGHLWMTMTNGLRASHSANARKLRPLTMPCQWSEEKKEEDVVMTGMDEIEILDEGYALRQNSPRHDKHGAEEEIWEGLEDEVDRGNDDAFEEELLLDDEKINLSFLGDGFEGLCLFGGDADEDTDVDVDVGGESDGMSDELDFVDYMEEMLFRGHDN